MTDASAIAPPDTLYAQESKGLEILYAPIQPALLALEKIIVERLNTQVPIISQAAHYLIDAGGKRIRPAILLAFAQILQAPQAVALELSAVIEFIHSATLLHDDVVDEAKMRRGLDSTNQRFGNAVSVLVGDFLYSRAFQMMVEVNQMEVMKILSSATNTIAEGEVLQLINIGNVHLTRAQYQQTIYCKTARLFEASAELAVVIALSAKDPRLSQWREHARAFGAHIGHAFQLSDDALDYNADSQFSGKRISQDLHEGKITLPLLIALECASNAQALKDAIVGNTPDKFALAKSAIEETHGIHETLKLARTEAESAISALSIFPDHPAKQLLISIGEFVRSRVF